MHPSKSWIQRKISLWVVAPKSPNTYGWAGNGIVHVNSRFRDEPGINTETSGGGAYWEEYGRHNYLQNDAGGEQAIFQCLRCINSSQEMQLHVTQNVDNADNFTHWFQEAKWGRFILHILITVRAHSWWTVTKCINVLQDDPPGKYMYRPPHSNSGNCRFHLEDVTPLQRPHPCPLIISSSDDILECRNQDIQYNL